MKSSTQLLVVLFWIIGIVIAALSITGIPQAQNPTCVHLFIVILVLVIFMGMVSLANCLLSKGNKDNYEVNDAEKGGKENTAFDNESDSKKDQQQQQQTNGTTAGTSGKEDEKWVQNYVPFGDYPKGNIVYVKEVIIKRSFTQCLKIIKNCLIFNFFF